MREIDILIGDKEYHVKVAYTDEEKSIGLSKTKKLPKDEGMLFVYDEVQDEVYYTMEDTTIPLDIIFIDGEGCVISVNKCEALQKEPIYGEDVLYVLEVNAGSGIRKGDELEEIDSDNELTEDDKKEISKSKMLVLDEEGNVQFKLEGGERIFSRINTKSLIKAALRAFHSDSDQDYKRVGRLIFRYLDRQDSNTPEYVQAPE